MAALLAAAWPDRAAAAVHTLGDTTTASPITVAFDDATGRMTVTVKSNGAVWNQGTAGGGSTWASPSGWTNPDDLNASGSATLNTYPVTISLQLTAATGELKVTISGNTVSIPNKIIYPYAFFPADGSGFAVLPYNGGFVVPTTATTWSQPSSHSRMEWFGGTDSSWNQGWMCIADPADDMFLVKQTPTVNGSSRLGGAFEWRGSNANAGLTPNLLSYSRTATYTFYTSGGYVAQAKKFRDFAITKGWHKSLAQKALTNPDVSKLYGAPLIYLWGDGRSDTMLSALATAGIQKAAILLSINHVDHNNFFPNQAYANGSGWSTAVTSRGWVSGIYDIYAGYNSGQTTPPFNGFNYLWASAGAGASSATSPWAYRKSDGSQDVFNGRANIAHSKAYPFARDTRLPQHISQFGLGAFFFDTTCAVEPLEDYDTANGHTASRAQDIVNRAALLAAASGATAPNHNKLAATEQAKSWAVPHIHWTEGMFRLGASNTPGGYGTFNNNAYPQILTDVYDPGASLSTVLTTGYQVPLWELVYHDALLSTQHWHLTHNKLLYAWDFADLSAMIRGQAPLLNLTYDGALGTVGTVAPAEPLDARPGGKKWSTRWLNSSHGSTYADVAARVMQTYNNVCAWQGIVADLPMYDHKVLSADAANNYLVQNSEFSDDNGASGHGIVVNVGSYPGTGYDMTGATWNGTIRGNNLSVAVGAYATYSWSAADTTPPGPVTGFAATPGNAQVQLSWTNPGDTDLTGIRVLRKTGSYPTSATDAAATVVLDDNVAPLATSVTDTGLTNGTVYYYATYAYDEVPNYSTAAQVTATPTAPTTVTFESVASEDGWVLESSETSGTGGSTNSSNTTLRIGDDASRKQYKLVVSFDTSSIPDGATITAATLKLTRSSVTGTNPFSWSGNTCYADIANGSFNGNASLENGDFQASATATQVATMSSPPSNNSQSTGALNSSGLSAVNKTGRTQLRVYFSQDDNNNSTADYVQIYSSNYTTDTSRRPKLEITYQ